MNYAEVAVNSPTRRSTFTYAVPSHLSTHPGHTVWVPFGSRVIQGIVVALSDQTPVGAPREIAGPVTGRPVLSPLQLELARWISEYYLSPLYDALALMLPPGSERRAITHIQLADGQMERPALTPDEQRIVGIVKAQGRTTLGELEKAAGTRTAREVTDRLLNRGLLIRTVVPEQPRARPRTAPYVKLLAGSEQIEAARPRLRRSRAHKQLELLEFLAEEPRPVPVSELRKHPGCSIDTIRALEKQGLVSVQEVRVWRDPLARVSVTSSQAPPLTPSQEAARAAIDEAVTGETTPAGRQPVFLLFGVTGSGKTEVYLQALSRVIATGRQGICLIPEIALTRQTVERFAGRFPGRVALLHSGLSPGERFDEWQRIAGGDADIAIGPRSALFAPLPNLGLIIIDEEHEWTYKQDDKSPRYHARDVALRLAELKEAVVILGSATPDVASYHRAREGEYRLVELKERITPLGHSPLPDVDIVDLREELKAGNTGPLSRLLVAAMRETLAQGEQTILFLNRRGTATFVRCRNCGFVFRCPRCSIALTYHSIQKKLTCHRCRYAVPAVRTCPQCSRPFLRFLGIGTQRVEEEVGHIFPDARLLRWDRDAITTRYAHEELLKDFRDHKADVLIGTQMIAKGLDLPQVTLAGVISADTGLNFPDFRSGEHTFQLLCQVAGRAGRGIRAGRVIIQTYSPDNYTVRAAAGHDYAGFYGEEIEYRRRFRYPPFSRLVRLAYSHVNEAICRREAERIHRLIRDLTKRDDECRFDVIGPVPAFAQRTRGRYRWQLFIRGSDPVQVLVQLALPQGWTVDVDPVGML